MHHLALIILLSACASASPSDVRPDSGPRPPGAAECSEDHHACGTACLLHKPNIPSVGCTFGCGAPCPTPPSGIATCTSGGTCDFTCPAHLAKVDGQCVAAICDERDFACGTTVDDAGTTFACGTCAASDCVDHQCTVAPDAREDNNTPARATLLGDFDDAADRTLALDDLSIHGGDEDWFRFHITDGFDAGNPDGSIELVDRTRDLGWLSSSHELTVWFKCDTGNVASTVRCGEWFTEQARNTLTDPLLGVGCTSDGTYVVWSEIWPSCQGIEDSGIVTFRVRKRTPPRGDHYDVRVAVD
jgi:hypothetical protein